MTLDEAIAHHEWAAESSQGEVRKEHEQHVKWLTIAKMAMEGASKDRLFFATYSFEIARNDLMERDCLRFAEENDRLKAENAKLRSELESVGTAAYLYGRGDLKAENAKLRELVKAMEPYLCCMPFASCDTLAANVRERMRELGLLEDE